MKIGAFTVLSLALSACSQSDSSVPPAYDSVVVPTDRLAAPAARQRGRELFKQNCAICHGVDGDGQGVRHRYLSGPPANFKSKAWAERTTPRRVYFVLREGVQGTSMPGWPALSEEQTWDLAAYVLSVHEEGP